MFTLVYVGMWSSPTDTGSRPRPCCDFSLTMVREHGAVLCGGSVPDNGCTSQASFFINLANMVGHGDAV